MAKPRRQREYKLERAVTRVEHDVKAILTGRQSTRYLEGVVLMYSLIENVPKWLVLVKMLWDRSDHVMPNSNTLLHQLYLFSHRRNSRVLRARLTRLVNVAEDVFRILGTLIRETGADSSYSIFWVRRRRQLLI